MKWYAVVFLTTLFSLAQAYALEQNSRRLERLIEHLRSLRKHDRNTTINTVNEGGKCGLWLNFEIMNN